MHVFFFDDSRQRRPTRDGMGELIALGGVVIDAEKIKPMEQGLDQLCANTGFPAAEIFKWSPGPELWMHQNLVQWDRERFLRKVVDIAKSHECGAVFVAVEPGCQRATGRATTPEMDAVHLMLERAQWFLREKGNFGIIITDRQAADAAGEQRFLLQCMEALRTGTEYVMPERMVMSVLTLPMRLSRLLQVADVVTSCTLARVSGENRFSPPIFNEINGLFLRTMGRVGGYGAKLHPDYKYANLYHWVFGDTHFWRNQSGDPMPVISRPYYGSEWAFRNAPVVAEL